MESKNLSPHPGDILRGIIAETGMSQRELAAAIGKTAPVLNGILKGKRNINAEIAILLEAAIPETLTAEEWMRIQSLYDLDEMRFKDSVAKRKESVEEWNLLKRCINFNVIKKRLGLGDDIETNIPLLFAAMNVHTIEEFQLRTDEFQECFKKSDKVQTDSANLLSWRIIVRTLSMRQATTRSFDKMRLPELKSKINSIIYDNFDTISRVREVCSEYGIKFIYEGKLEKVPVDGYSFWIGDNPTIAMTGRMNRIDNFAFTFMHELGHIEKHLKANSEDDFIDTESITLSHDIREDEANEYATHAIWQGDDPLNIFGYIINPFAAANYLKRISSERVINLGVVVGQFRFFCKQHNIVKNSYAICSELTQKIL